MIGLEYICQCYDKSYNSIAEELGISRQSINGWLKGTRLIPTKHLSKLAKIFELPEEYFQKELSDEEKDDVKKQKVNFDIDKIVEMIMDIDDVKKLLDDKTTEEQIDYVEVMYHGILDTIQYILNKKTSKMETDEFEKELIAVKKVEEKEIKETLEIVRQLMFQVGFDFKKFRQYIKDYK